MNAPLLELVGFDKLSKRQREFHKLRVISVRGHLVDRHVNSHRQRAIKKNYTMYYSTMNDKSTDDGAREKFIAFSDSVTLRRIETLASSWPTYRALT